jgi:3-phosphoshikimate 1-carboxyvinyltransferase
LNYLVNYRQNSTNEQNQKINLPSSKSEANRMLIIKALTTNGSTTINNLSSARDTQTLFRLLGSIDQSNTEFDVLDAGTTMRFLTAFLAITTQKQIVITGTQRMKQRPIGILVEALRSIGCQINYLEKEGYPPLSISPFKEQINQEISIPGNVSSQYISALLMVAPLLLKGLTINILTPIYSQPYIDMTIGLMAKASIKVEKLGSSLRIQNQEYKAIEHTVESDWSGASYWFSFIALSEIGRSIKLLGLKEDSLQGDQAIRPIMQKLGVQSTYDQEGIILKKNNNELPEWLEIDFKEFPDLAQTVVACCAALKVNLKMTGLESLRIKETDRIKALHNEMSKFNCSLTESSKGVWEMKAKEFSFTEPINIHTYEDHRMAMSFAPLALKGPLLIDEIDVVNKSYPSFWTDLKSVGFELTEQ